MLEAARGPDGEIHFEETGDPLIDKWEREIREGITPDLTEGLSKKALSQLEQERTNLRSAHEAAREIDGFDLSKLKSTPDTELQQQLLGNSLATMPKDPSVLGGS